MSIFNSEHKYPVIIGNLRVPMLFTFSQNPNSITITMDKEFNQTQTLGGYTFEHWGKKPMILRGEVTIRKFNDLDGFVGSYRDNRKYDLSRKNGADPIIVPEYVTLRTLFDIDQKRLSTYVNDVTKKNFTSAVTKEKDKKVNTAASGETPEVATTISKLLNKTSFSTVTSGFWNDKQNWYNNLSDTFIYYKDTIYSGFFQRMQTTDSGEQPFVLKVSFEFVVTSTSYDWITDWLFASDQAVAKLTTLAWGTASTVSVAGKLFNSFLGNDSSENITGVKG